MDRQPDRADEPAAASSSTETGLTRLLEDASGNPEAFNRAFTLVYDELRVLARSRLRHERDGHTLNTTALVHEAYIKLVDQTRVQWQNRAHFFAIAARAMHRILVNYAEARHAAKRGGGAVHIPLDEAGIAMTEAQVDELLALDVALGRLKAFNERGADVVVYRFIGGLSYEEIGEVMGISAITVRRSWSAARAWLRRELGDALHIVDPAAGDPE